MPRNITLKAPALLTSLFAYMDYCKLGEGVAKAAFVGTEPAPKRGKGSKSQPINESKCKDQEEETEKTDANKKEVTTYCRPLSDSYFCCPTLVREKQCAITLEDLDPDDPTKVLTAFPCGHHFSKSLSEDPGPFERLRTNPTRCVMCRKEVEYYYTGPLLFGKPHTLNNGLFGIRWSKKGSKYVGEFKMGIANGKGTIKYSKGDVYDGEWKNGKHNGKGKYTFLSGAVYKGEHKNGQRSGQGVMKWPDGNFYDGEWKDDKSNGKGKEKNFMGYYQGEFKNNTRNGQGTMTYSNGDVYTGEWKDGKRHGKGTLTYFNRNVYDGEWKNGWQHGQGKMRYSDGDVYAGEWKDGKEHGQGKHMWHDGEINEGKFEDGEFLG